MNPRRRRIAVLPLFFLLVAGCGKGADQHAHQEVEAPATPPFHLSEFLPDPPPRPDRFDWEDVVAEGAYATFERLRRSLVRNTVTPESILGFEAIITKQDRLARCRELLTRLDGDQRLDTVRRLYAELMGADSNADILYEYLQIEIDRALNNADKDDLNRGRYYGWGLSIPNQACVIAYEATSQVRFLELLSQTIETILPYRDSELGRVDDVRKRAMHSWGSNRYAGEGRYTADVTLAGRISYPIASFCRLVRNDARLEERFGRQAERFLQVARQCIDEYDDEFRTITGTDQGYYYSVTHDWEEPINHMAWAGNTLILLHDITGEEKYGRMARQLAAYFRGGMWIDKSGNLVWSYQLYQFRGEKGEHVWKARTSTEFALLAHRYGVVFTQQDMVEIADTFLNNVYRGNGHFSARINDVYEDMEQYINHRGGYLCLTPFLVFDDFRPQIREVLEEMVSTRLDIGGWLRRSHGLIAYAYRLNRIESDPAVDTSRQDIGLRIEDARWMLTVSPPSNHRERPIRIRDPNSRTHLRCTRTTPIVAD